MIFHDLSLWEVLFFVVAFGVILYLILNAPAEHELAKTCGPTKSKK